MFRFIGYTIAVVLIWRILLFELVWLLPRQPLTGLFIALFFHRLASIHVPNNLYFVFSSLFDGDGTPSVFFTLLFTVITLKVINPKRKVSKFLRLVLILTPICWISRIVDAELNHLTINQNLKWLQIDNEIPHSRWFRIQDHFHNTLFAPISIESNKTVVFKHVSKEERFEDECDQGWFPIPGDNPLSSIESWNTYEKTGNLALDVYFPRNTTIKNPKVILYLHGGGWETGHRNFLSQNYHGGLPYYLLKDNIIISPSYRMSCMGLRGTDILEDVYDATKYIYENSEELIGQTKEQLQIIPWGTSAGGTLGLLLAYKYSEEFPIKAVLNFYGVTELRVDELYKLEKTFYEQIHNSFFIEATRHVCKKEDPITKEIIEDKQCFHDFSPAAQVTKHTVPTLTVHGQQDGLVLESQARLLQQALNKHDVLEVTIIVQGVHDCDVYTSSFCSQAAIKAIDAFLKHLDTIQE